MKKKGFFKQALKETGSRNMLGEPEMIFGATARTRTADLLITNQLLYQLSYGG